MSQRNFPIAKELTEYKNTSNSTNSVLDEIFSQRTANFQEKAFTEN